MALTGWTKKCTITVNKSTVLANGIFPIFLKTNSFPTGMLTLGGADACKADGSDIRFSTDINGDTLIPFSIAKISLNATPANSKVLIVVKLDMVTTTNKDIYCWWGNPSAEKVSPVATNGDYSCWTGLAGGINFYGVNYLQETPTVDQWKFALDSTTKFSAISAKGLPPVTTGPITELSAITISDTVGLQTPEFVSMSAPAFGVVAFVYLNAVVGKQLLITEANAVNNIRGVGWGDRSPLSEWSQSWGATANAAAEWGLAAFYKPTNTLFLNYYWKSPSNLSSSGSFAITANFNTSLMGVNTDASMKGKVCFFLTVRDTPLTVAMLNHLYNVMITVTTPAVAGAITTSSASASITITGLIAGTEVRIFRTSDLVELGGVEDSTTSFNMSYSGAQTVDISIHHILYVPIRYSSFALDGSSITLAIQQIKDRWYVNP